MLLLLMHLMRIVVVVLGFGVRISTSDFEEIYKLKLSIDSSYLMRNQLHVTLESYKDMNVHIYFNLMLSSITF